MAPYVLVFEYALDRGVQSALKPRDLHLLIQPVNLENHAVEWVGLTQTASPTKWWS